MRLQRLAPALLMSLLASAAFAEGEIELNHTCATSTGCLVGDAPGYPIEATQRGSYVLTSNLVVPAGSDGVVFDEGASLDLRGFTIGGPVSCPLGACPASSAGIGIYGGAGNAISNGRVAGFGLNCIEVGRGSRIERVNVTECAQHGIVAGGGSYVASNQIDLIGKKGIQFLIPLFPPTSAGVYRDNTIGVTGDLSVEHGRASGPNTCLDQKCGRTGQPKFVLSATRGSGAGASTRCPGGFHFASLPELSSTAHEYAWHLDPLDDAGRDSGLSVPYESLAWVRSGEGVSSGARNCSLWTSSRFDDGAIAAAFNPFPPSNWVKEGVMAYLYASCAQDLPSWCVQD